MKIRVSRAIAGLLATALVAGGSLALVEPAQAYTGTPPWIAGDSSNLGGILIYDASGQQITAGSDYNELGAFYAGQKTAATAGATKANLDIAFPDAANQVPSTWFTANLQASTAFATDPAKPTATGPVIKKTGWPAGPTPIADTLSGGTLSTAPNYENTFELRMSNSGPNGVTGGGKYWAVVIEFNPAAAGGATFDGLAPQAWRQVWPTVSTTQATVSTPVPSASGTYAAGQQITLTSQSSVAGTIQFQQDSVDIGSAKTVDGSFNATSDTITLAAGDHSFTAVFTPSDTVNYTGATSSALSISVNGAPTTVSTPTPSLTSPRAFGNPIKLTATATAGVPGTIRFKDKGGFIAGVPAVTVNGSGAATSVSFQPSVGAHSFTAVFTPTDYVNYSQSTSSALSFTVTKGVLVNKVRPSITGVLKVGKVLTANPGTWTPAGTTYTYVWKRGAAVVGKAKTYKTTAKDKGKILTVTVTASKANYTSKAVTSLGKKIS